MATLINRGLSLLVYLGYLMSAYFTGAGIGTLKIAVFLLLPMACIWFPEELGGYTGTMRLHAITASTPAFLVCAGGWLILVGLPIIYYLTASGT